MKYLIFTSIVLAILTITVLVGCSDEDPVDLSFNIPTLRTGEPAETLEAFEARLEDLRLQMNIPAVSAAIVKDGQIVWARGFGYADPVNGVAATETTAYHLASITKPIASTIIMQLVEEGLLDLEAPVSDFGIEIESSGIVRVWHLLTHTSEGNPGTHFNYSGNRFSLLDQVATIVMIIIYQVIFCRPMVTSILKCMLTLATILSIIIC